MSILLGLVQTTASVLSTVSPSPSPTPSPVVVQAVATSSPSWLDGLNNWAAGVSQTDLIAFAAVLSVAIQGALQKIPFFTHVIDYVQDVRRFTLAVFIPGVVTVGAGLAQGHNDFHLLPVVFLGAQILFYAVRFLVAKAIAAFTTTPAPATAGLANPSNGTSLYTTATTGTDTTSNF